tara:strand:- start:12429 stop:12581 length:153 start_codon:yes stop_codon:yes gene_type:complete
MNKEDLEEVKKLIEYMGDEGWNDGCGCCSNEQLKNDEDYKKVVAILEKYS